MADCFSRQKRSEIMKRIGSKNSNPEVLVRQIAHSLGYRFRLHQDTLPGKPDIVFPRLKKVIFVHGCFWHGHANCNRARRPQNNKAFWDSKLDKNKLRDQLNAKALNNLGWDILVVWQCQLRDLEATTKRINKFLCSSR